MDKSNATAYIALITIGFGTILYFFPEQKEIQPRIPEVGGKDLTRHVPGKLDRSKPLKPATHAAHTPYCDRQYAAQLQSC